MVIKAVCSEGRVHSSCFQQMGSFDRIVCHRSLSTPLNFIFVNAASFYDHFSRVGVNCRSSRTEDNSFSQTHRDDTTAVAGTSALSDRRISVRGDITVTYQSVEPTQPLHWHLKSGWWSYPKYVECVTCAILTVIELLLYNLKMLEEKKKCDFMFGPAQTGKRPKGNKYRYNMSI